MNELEERLRADLFGATELIDAEPDLDAVVREGDRVLRGRFVRRVAGGVAAALAVGLVAWVAAVPREVPGALNAQVIDVEVGGATVFVLNVERFEHI